MNKLLRIFTFLLVTCSLLLATSRASLATYDPTSTPNNKFGIHILHPSEISEVANLVNNNGGDWGYVTVPIQPSDRDKSKWQDFMHACRDKHLIPIVRITTIPLGGTWDQGKDTDLVDFANFLDQLDWPIANRYIVLFNEVNRETEWGGQVDPSSYARIVKNAYTIFKERSGDFFMLGPALDDALPDSGSSMSASNYLRAMQKEDKNVWTYFDGWASHSYPNPAFSSSPSKTGWTSIVSYKSEISSLGLASKPVFITETGWDQQKLSKATLDSYWRQAYIKWNGDKNVVAFTPFVLHGGDQFAIFSLYGQDGNLNPSGQAISDAVKTAGAPTMAENKSSGYAEGNSTHMTDSAGSGFQPNSTLLGIVNFFRSLFGLLEKGYLTVGSKTLEVELATTAKDWEHGLSDRDGLADGTGMLFIFPRDHVPIFWMKDMKFDLDIVWIRSGEIVDINKNVPAPSGDKLPTYSPSSLVNMVLEVPAGLSDQYGWEKGTKIELEK